MRPPPPPRPTRSRTPPQPKKCTTLECQLSDLRSQTSVWNIGEQVKILQAKIQKKTRALI